MALEVFLEARLAPKDSHLKVSLAKALENTMFGHDEKYVANEVTGRSNQHRSESFRHHLIHRRLNAGRSARLEES